MHFDNEDAGSLEPISTLASPPSASASLPVRGLNSDLPTVSPLMLSAERRASLANSQQPWRPYAGLRGVTPVVRSNHVAVVHEKRVIVWGGMGKSKDKLDHLLILDIENNTWMKPSQKGTPPSARYCATADCYKDEVWIFGGFAGTRLGDVHVLDMRTLTWRQPAITGSLLPQPRSHHCSALFGHSAFIFGGLTSAADGRKLQPSAEMWILNIETHTWTCPVVRGNLPSGRLLASMSVAGPRLLLFGGYDGNERLNDVYLLDLSTMTWTKPVCAGTPPSPRYGHTMNLIGDKILIIGGSDGYTTLSDIFCLDLTTLYWSCLAPTSIPARSGHTASLVDGRIFIHGGDAGIAHRRFDDVQILECSRFPLLKSLSLTQTREELERTIHVFLEDLRRMASGINSDGALQRRLDGISSSLRQQLEKVGEEQKRIEKEAETQRELLREEIEHFAAEKKKMETIDFKARKRIVLNVGGQRFETTLSTLTRLPLTLFATMFSGRHYVEFDADGSVFIDRDGTHFRFILNYLRDGTLVFPHDKMVIAQLQSEADFYQLDDLATHLSMLLTELQ